MRRPFGNRGGPPEPIGGDADDGPTVQVLVPQGGQARVLSGLGLPSFASDNGPETLTRPLPRFGESNSDLFPRAGADFDAAQTLRRPQTSPAAPAAGALEPGDWGDTWTLPRSTTPRAAPPPPPRIPSRGASGSLPPLPMPPAAGLAQLPGPARLPSPLAPPRPVPAPFETAEFPPAKSEPFPLLDARRQLGSLAAPRPREHDPEIEVRGDLLVDPDPSPMAAVRPTPPAPTERALLARTPLAPTEPAAHRAAPAFVPKGSIAPPGPVMALGESPVVEYLRARPPLRAALIGMAAAVTIGAAAALVLLLALGRGEPDAANVPAASTAAAPAPSAPISSAPTCVANHAPVRLAGELEPNVQLQASRAPGLTQVAVGAARARHVALGLVVDTQTLRAETRLEQSTQRPVVRVTPLTDRSPVTFAVDHDESRATLLRSVPSSRSFRIGMSSTGVVRVEERREPSVVWPMAGRTTTEPRFAVLEDGGYAVAFRAGGDAMLGMLAPNGSRETDLVRLDVAARDVGEPALAASDGRLAVVVAARGSNELWRLYAARARSGTVPGALAPLDVNPRGGEQRHPSIVSLGSGWVVSWLEGTSTTLSLRARVLDGELAPRGPILELSSSAIVDAPGALAVRGDRVLSVFARRNGPVTELWGAVLTCH